MVEKNVTKRYYSPGGVLPGGPGSYVLDPEECAIGRRDGLLRCMRPPHPKCCDRREDQQNDN